MADRKDLPDIMGGLLNGSASKKAQQPAEQPASLPVGQAAAQPAEQPTRKPARQPRGKPAKQQLPASPDSEEKAKCTFYLSQETVDALEDGWLQLRRLARDRASVSKSGIVEAALQIALEELAKKGELSELAGRLAES